MKAMKSCGTVSGWWRHYHRNERPCDECRIAYNTSKTTPQERERHRKYEAARRAADPTLRQRAREYRTGLTDEEKQKLWDKQDGRCYLCGDPLPANAPIDHDHKCCPKQSKRCGRCTRGLTCNRCNPLIGFALDSPDRLRRIADKLLIAHSRQLSRTHARQLGRPEDEMQRFQDYVDMPLRELEPYDGNARKHDDAKLDLSVASHGQYRTVVVRRIEETAQTRHVILAGHGTVDALRRKGAEKVRVEILTCDDEEALAIHLVDNATADAADYFKDLLASQLERAAEFDFEGTGWTQEEFDKMRGRGDDDEPDLPEDPPHWGVVVECTSEEQQARLLEQLSEEGFSVRALMA